MAASVFAFHRSLAGLLGFREGLSSGGNSRTAAGSALCALPLHGVRLTSATLLLLCRSPLLSSLIAVSQGEDDLAEALAQAMEMRKTDVRHTTQACGWIGLRRGTLAAVP